MVEINLLPWRVCSYEYKKRQSIQLTITLIFFFLVLFFIMTGWLNAKLLNKNQVVFHLQEQLKSINRRPASDPHDDVESVSNVISAFQNNQTQLTHFFKRLIQLTPDGIVWLEMMNENDQMILKGNTSSFQTLLLFVKWFEGEPKNFHADIIKIKSLPHSNLLQFSLRCSRVIFPLSDRILERA